VNRSALLPPAVREFAQRVRSAGEGVYGLRGSSPALLLALWEEPFLLAVPSAAEAQRLLEEVEFFLKALGLERNLLLLPEPDGARASGQRALCAKALKDRPSVVATLRALEAPLWDERTLRGHTLKLRAFSEYQREALRERLLRMGYVERPVVSAPGEFRLRAYVLDVFGSTDGEPLRAEFFGDTLERLSRFAPDTQLNTQELSQALLLPAREPQEGARPCELKGWRSLALGLELPGAVLLSPAPLRGRAVEAGLLPLAGYGLLPEERKGLEALGPAIKRLSAAAQVRLVCSSQAQAQRLRELLSEDALPGPPVLEPQEAFLGPQKVAITVGPLREGFYLPGLLVLTEKEVFGSRPPGRPARASRLKGLLEELEELRPGDYVVHRQHGIGRFLGILKAGAQGLPTESLVIEYARGSRLYVPLYGVEALSRYKAPQGGRPPELDRLGSRAWQRRRQRVKKRLKEMAQELIRVYAERKVLQGHAFSPDGELHRQFASFFPYEETSDQLKAVREITEDMEAPRPMDRLLCGDVGYGKTEVAMRAAFKAVYDGKQVVVLVPTTLLCEQHFRVFSQRFEPFGVKVQYLSRFKSPAERRKTLQAFERTEVDILIATHSLLRAKASFRNLGLLIIDEEHRFGVAQKERLKALRRTVDVLSMSATPIPRTLQMALTGLRDMSLLESPPEERLAVKTVISVFEPGLIREAIRRELQRGGQVFFVHNRVQDIHRVQELLRRLLPELRLGLAHGQMPERQLEATMTAFLGGELQVLLCTAIIGSGLDIPTANTLIVNRADMMGLADLYQLKGRVGRGAEQAYAYFLVPREAGLTAQAQKRLQALEELSYLGAGFKVALKDLEIRGAGNLLGPEQSGYIREVGFDTYVELLQEAVAELKGLRPPARELPGVQLRLNALVPQEYVADVSVRLGIYRRLGMAQDAQELQRLAAELRERFGPLPQELQALLEVMHLRLLAEAHQVRSITQLDGRLRFSLAQGASPSVQGLLRRFGSRVRFLPEGFELALRGPALKEAREALQCLTG